MKTNFLALVTVLVSSQLFSLSSFAKVADFNNLINENIKAQDTLHQEVKVNMDLARQNLREASPSKVTVMEDFSQYSVPSQKLRFKKEVYQYRPSTKKQMDRVATELKNADREF